MTDRIKILVVDDEEIVLASVSRILKREGHEVEGVLTAHEGIEKARTGEYSLVITDLMMPEMNGIEMMHALRTDGLDVPFLMVTGYPTIRTAMQALRLGAIDYIPKPFTRVELLGPVNRALRRREVKDVGEEGASGAAAKTVTPGDRFVLPEHSWAIYDQDGTVAIGVEGSFLRSIGSVEKIEAPGMNEMIEQGYPTIRLHADDGHSHGVFAPFSGRVTAVNDGVADSPERLSSTEWVIRVIPSNLKAETAMLVKV